MSLRVQLLPEAIADSEELGPTVSKALVALLMELDRELNLGAPLGAHDGVGDLRGCRKIYFDLPGHPGKPRWRIVYWLAPSEARPRLARVLAIGPRAGLEGYERASQRYNADRQRLGQPPVEELDDTELSP